MFVDDTREGEAPLKEPLYVDIGEHLVVVKKNGAEVHRERVSIAGGTTVVVLWGVLTWVTAGETTATVFPSRNPNAAGMRKKNQSALRLLTPK